ncbi:hypothetical protein LTR56_003644 [Elasticomyces elasticus]|nr:hypothetical protein LTR56_003644 [Elasticomyces elasticus]KAK3663777.1 hypothetical protein LTR22_005478 [Elasticomyces elasticus]KAK4927296.1 hypothetical protein LTR49_005961 [Elasticomyces elasticus]KAK5767298.1 hypothetical protein LTS12_002451 [Elasticomyces elasticus]
MPPRKKVKTSLTASPTPVSNPQTLAEADNASPASDRELWTDEEELGLFKGLMTWKPTGIHKHFRLLALHHFLLENHYIHPRNEHTKPAGIWRKLNTLYDLEALDEREDARQLSDLSLEDEDEDKGDGESDAYSEAENKIHRQDFELPREHGGEGEGYGEMMWRQRFAGPADVEGSESPPALPELNRVEEMPVRFTPSFSVEPSEAPTPSGRTGRAKAASKKKDKAKGAAAAVPPAPNSRRSARQAGSVAGDEEEEDGEEDESESRDEEASTRSTPAISAKAAAAAKGRARGNAKVKGKAKARVR